MNRKSRKKRAFTIVELLTIMSIIVLLMGLLLPALNKVKRYARKVKQRAQFHSVEVAMDLYNAELDGYPDSDAIDSDSSVYNGAMRLCEAMIGQDLMGFNPDSVFNADLLNADDDPNPLYFPYGYSPTADEIDALEDRSGPFLQIDNANAHRLKNIYGTGNVGSFNENLFVLCDEFSKVKSAETGKKVGMPVLYYKADTLQKLNDPNEASSIVWDDSQGNIYNYMDNDALVQLGKPWENTGATISEHIMDADQTPGEFYENIMDKKIEAIQRPYRADSYILLSAGYDGEYGTRDDIFNFVQE